MEKEILEEIDSEVHKAISMKQTNSNEFNWLVDTIESVEKEINLDFDGLKEKIMNVSIYIKK